MAVVLMAAVVYARRPPAAREPRVAAAHADTPAPSRVAVLYFDDHSRERDLGYIASGLTEQLIQELAQIQNLRVISRNGVKSFRDGRASLDSISRVLRVGSIVEGSVSRSGNRLRINVRLVDAVTGMEIQSRTLERPMTELFALQDELAEEVSGFLRQRLGEAIRLRERVAGTGSAAARERLFRAQQLRDGAAQALVGDSPLRRESAERMLASAGLLLREATRLDPGWAHAWVDRGWLHVERSDLLPEVAREASYRTALSHAGRALELAPGSPEALELRGTIRWRMVQLGGELPRDSAAALAAAAERDLDQALARNPSLARAWLTLSQLLRVQEGRLADADRAARRALDADEFLLEAPLVMERLYRSSVQLARWDTAAAWCNRGRARYPNDWRFVECKLTLMGYEGEKPNVALARRLRGELEQLDPAETASALGRRYSPVYRDMVVARVAARAGDEGGALALMERAGRAVGEHPELQASYTADAAYVWLLLGRRDSAVALLGRHLEAKPRLRASVARDVKFRALHEDPRFRRLVEERPEARGG
jgi:TolB-like protein/tetratricopeptide (TPR) repeat protein